MSLRDSIIQVQDRLEKLMRKRRFKKANDERKAAVEERAEYLECAGKLNQSLIQFKTTIRSQAANIREGMALQRDTSLQEDELWDAAIGYMLVQDAQYAMKTLFNYDSIKYAYDLLNSVTKYMNGGRAKFALVPGVRQSKERNKAGYLNSEHLIKEKEAFLETFFEELKQTGDIEKCMAAMRSPVDRDAGRRTGGFAGSTGAGGKANSLRAAAKSIVDDQNEEYSYELTAEDIDIHEPVASASNSLREAMEESSVEENEEAISNGIEA